MLAVYAGSFDPVTPGHVNVAGRAADEFGRVVVVVAINSCKRPRFTTQQRVSMLKSAFGKDRRISVDECHTWVAPWARRIGATTLIRGSRNWLETMQETLLAVVNFGLGRGLPTRLYRASPALRNCSSSRLMACQTMSSPPSLLCGSSL